MGTTQAQEDKAKVEKAAKLGVEAFVYGFPLVIMDVSKRVQTNVEEPNHDGHATIIQIPTRSRSLKQGLYPSLLAVEKSLSSLFHSCFSPYVTPRFM